MTEARPNSAMRRVLIVIAVFAVLVLLVLGIRHATHDDILVRTARVTVGDVVSAVSTNGKVEPVQEFQAHAGAPAQVTAVYIQAGQQVAAGTLLLKLDNADATAKVQTALSSVAAANATVHDVRDGGTQDETIGLRGDVSRAKLQADQAQSSLAALQQLQARGAASASEVTAARERLLSAQASLASATQRSTARYASTDIQRATAQAADSRASLAAAQHDLANSLIRAPFAGTVFSLPVRAYDFVQTGEELVQVADLSRMQVHAYFDEPEIGKLRINDSVKITWDAKPGRTWHGHILRVPTTVITYGTRNVGECLITVDDATGDLLPNTNVTVNVTTQQVHNVLTLPREALRTLGASNFVFVLRGGKLVKTPVDVGALNLIAVQITGGLASGETIALNATSNVDLTDGLQVKEAH